MIGVTLAGPATKVVWGQEPSKPKTVEMHVREPLSRHLGWAGVVTTLAGVAVMGPWGNEYEILGDSYCVTDRGDVYDGGCNARGKQLGIGMLMVGGGIFTAWLGFHDVNKTVRVSPSISKKGFGVSTTVRWK